MFTEPVLHGLQGTLLLTVTSMTIGIALGVVIAIMRLSPNRILSWMAWIYTWFFRAVPRLVLAVLFGNLNILWARIGFGLPFDEQIGKLFGIDDLNAQFYSVKASDLLAGFVAGMLALGLSEAAYMAEIVRAGIQSIEPGQSEAAVALGMSRTQVLRRIVLPQAMRVIVPPTGNEVIAMVKDTSLVAFVPVTYRAVLPAQCDQRAHVRGAAGTGRRAALVPDHLQHPDGRAVLRRATLQQGLRHDRPSPAAAAGHRRRAGRTDNG